MEFQIKRTVIYGLNKSMIASGNAMRTTMQDNELEANDKDMQRAIKLGNTNIGEGHDNFLNGIIVQFDIYAPLYMWKQLQRYHFLDFISSQSTMHKLAKFDIKKQCVKVVDKTILNRYQEMIFMYNKLEEKLKAIKDEKILEYYTNIKNKSWYRLVASLPCGFVLGATMTTNYRQLKTIYHQRKNHKLKEWKSFCKWCEELPYFKELCLNENNN